MQGVTFTQDMRVIGRVEWAAGDQGTPSRARDLRNRLTAAPTRSQGLITVTSAPAGADTEQPASRSAPAVQAGVRSGTLATHADRGTSTSPAPQRQRAATAEAGKPGAHGVLADSVSGACFAVGACAP